jgi:hypothetical protein
LIRSFEAARAQLGSLSDQLESRENELSVSVRRAEDSHNANAKTLGRKLEHAIESFNQLDTTLNGPGAEGGDPDAGGNVALRIGERLEELERQRQRAQDAKFLLECWLEVSERGNLSTLEDLKRSPGGDGKVRCASIARQLLKISQRLDPNGTSQTNGTERASGLNGAKTRSPQVPASKHATREIIEKFLEGLETELLNQFDNHYRRQNFDGMKECAAALRDFNDGASVTALFVNQHQFFIDKSQLITEEIVGDDETWDQIADPDARPPDVEPGLKSLVDDVRIVVQEESQIIRRAFPFPEEILTVFLQRVFQQSVSLTPALHARNTRSLT